MKSNYFSIVGLIGQKPELKQSKNGNSYLNFSVAVNESFKTKEGEEKERTIWFRFVVFGEKAEKLEKKLDKGKKVLVEGSMNMKMISEEPKRYEPEMVAKTISVIEKEDKKEQKSEDFSDDDLFGNE